MDPASRVAEFIRREQLLTPGQRVVVGVSGGPDSLCLLGCLHQLGYDPILAHLDHGWRARSWEDAEFVLGLARELALPAVVERIPDGGGQESSAREERGRRARYEFLSRIASEHKAGAVAVGHTADDQVETILMHWLRGAGAEGLRGILPSVELAKLGHRSDPDRLRLVRPLLELARQDTEAYCRQAGWEPRRDETNLDRSFLRNRIRLELLPTLEGVQKQFPRKVLRSARLMREVADLVEGLARRGETSVVREAGKGALRISMQALRKEPAAVQRMILLRSLRRLRPDLRDIGFDAVNVLMSWVDGPGRRHSLVGGIQAHPLRGEWLLVAPRSEPLLSDLPQLKRLETLSFPIPSRVDLTGGWWLASRRTQKRDPDLVRRPMGSLQRAVLLDAGRLGGDLLVRGLRPGDRIRPIGMQGRVKVSDLFREEDVPAPARERWPIVECGPEIVWVVGLRLADSVKVTSRTRSAAVLELHPPRRASPTGPRPRPTSSRKR